MAINMAMDIAILLDLFLWRTLTDISREVMIVTRGDVAGGQRAGRVSSGYHLKALGLYSRVHVNHP